jgi:hypothetical protein
MDVSVLREHSSWRRCRSAVVTGDTDLPQEFDVVCLGAGVAGEAIAVGLRDSGLTLIGAVLVTPRAGEIVGELVLALRIPLKTLADVTPISSLQPRTRGKLARTRREGEQQSAARS